MPLTAAASAVVEVIEKVLTELLLHRVTVAGHEVK
jgi:hypothetical protein